MLLECNRESVFTAFIFDVTHFDAMLIFPLYTLCETINKTQRHMKYNVEEEKNVVDRHEIT